MTKKIRELYPKGQSSVNEKFPEKYFFIILLTYW